MVSIKDLRVGERGKITGFTRGNPAFRRRLLAIGLTPNTHFKVIRRAPMGDPIEIRVRNTSIAIRQNEANTILIEKVMS